MTTNEDTPVAITVLEGAHDPDGDPLRLVGANAGLHRAVITDGRTITVTPQKDFNGTFAVSYSVTDGSTVASSQATVTVLAVNDPPTAKSKTQSGHAKIAVLLEGSDVDGDALTFQIVAGPAHGELTGTPPSIEYHAATGFVGDDAFTYVARDGLVESEPATIQLHTAAGFPPIALSDFRFGSEDQAMQIHLLASDPDGDPLTFTIERAPSHGTLSGTAPDLVYTPAQDFSGKDDFTFSASDGIASSEIATVNINLSSVNDPPVAAPQSITTNEDGGVSISLAGTDVDSTSLSFSRSSPAHGTLSGFGQFLTYVPDANYHGPDSFTYTVSDFQFTSTATVTIDVTSVEDVPVAQAISRTVAEDGSIAVTLAGTDGDGDALTFAVVAEPEHGTLSGTAPALTYKPNHDYFGPDSFTYTASDGDDTSAAATVSLTVTAVNDLPVASDVSVTTDEDTDVAITLQATDVETASLTFTLVTNPADGTVTGTGANRVYHPAPNQSGTRSFTYRATDASGGFDDATVTIVIHPVNDPPTTQDDFAMTEPNTPILLAVLDNDSDADGDPVSIDSADSPEHGDVEIVEGKLRYTPDADFHGVEVFSYVAVDSHGASSSGKAHIGVGTFPPGAPTEAIATIAGSITSSDLSRAPAISDDGRVAAFTTKLALVADDTNGAEDVYVFDRATRSLARVSVATGGGEGNGASFRPHLSAGGRYVVFDSAASNLVAGDTNGAVDVFRRDRTTGETIRVSVATGGGEASGASTDPEISDDGNLVVFQSAAFDLISSDANTASDVFVRDIAAGTTTRVSVTTSGGEGDLGSTEPTISGDGRFIAFTSASINLVAGDTNNASDVFVRDRIAGTTVRVSVSSTGVEANSACSRASLSRDGRFLSFRSAATNLIGGTPPPVPVTQVYVRDTQQSTTTQTAQPPGVNSSIVWARLSADGRYVTAFSSAGVFIRDRFAGPVSTPAGAATWMWPMLSGNGRYLVVLDTSGGGRVVVTPNPL